jgi:N-sulfoglucosamine sulfohydrolase
MSNRRRENRIHDLLAIVFAAMTIGGFPTAAPAAPQPNILWITCEDISPNLGCYGDSFARTPTLDRMAAEGVRYNHAYATAGVCAVARSSIITGVWPSTLGSQHMRCATRLPAHIKCFTQYLRRAGYYCTNNSKKDYNFKEPAGTWDASSGKAHWRNREPDQPFFAVFNFTGTHESRCRKKPRDPRRYPPGKTPIPPFHPDTPEVRENWANYYENIEAMDKWAAGLLKQLEDAGVAEDTIVFFYSDHGAGMPGIKKWCWGPGLHVPLIVRVPEKYAQWRPGKAGKPSDRLVSFLDFAPTALSLAGLDIPDTIQGKAFLGPKAAPPRRYVHAIRDRMAERYDTVRVVRDDRFHYQRNFMPHLAWSQFVSYTEMMPTMKVWRRLAGEGKLNQTQARYFEPTKPLEELYDVGGDPWQINNLACDPKYADDLKRLRGEQLRWARDTRDTGLLPEFEMQTRSAQDTPYELAFDAKRHPQERLRTAADLANAMKPANRDRLVLLLSDDDSAVRWWGAVGLVALGEGARDTTAALVKALGDASPIVRVAAAEALAKLGKDEEALPVLTEALEHESPCVRLQAINVLDRMGDRAKNTCPAMRSAKMKGVFPADYLNRMTQYVPDGLEK